MFLKLRNTIINTKELIAIQKKGSVICLEMKDLINKDGIVVRYENDEIAEIAFDRLYTELSKGE